MNNTIIKYIHDPRTNAHVGVVAATKLTNDPAKVGIGWSFTALKKGDRFNRDKGKMIALNRANTGTGPEVVIPRIVQSELLEMRSRAVRYFKQSEVVD
jgi:hypothetical protein